LTVLAVIARCEVAAGEAAVFKREASAREYNPFPKAGGCARLTQFRMGLRFTESFRTGVVSFARP